MEKYVVRIEGGWNWLGIMPDFGISASELPCTTRVRNEPFSVGWQQNYIRRQVFATASDNMLVPPSVPPHRA